MITADDGIRQSRHTIWTRAYFVYKAFANCFLPKTDRAGEMPADGRVFYFGF